MQANRIPVILIVIGLVIVFIAIVAVNFLQAQHVIAADWAEADYQAYILEEMGGESEYRLPDGARVDILTPEYAIEVDFSYKWAESIGQALYYAEKTGKIPGIVLILAKRKNHDSYIRRLLFVARRYKIVVWLISEDLAIRHYTDDGDIEIFDIIDVDVCDCWDN